MGRRWSPHWTAMSSVRGGSRLDQQQGACVTGLVSRRKPGCPERVLACDDFEYRVTVGQEPDTLDQGGLDHFYGFARPIL